MLTPGRNIAIKVPTYRWDETLAFYRDRAGLTVLQSSDTSVAFQFGEMILWIDRVDTQSQSDVWLELFCDDEDPADALKQLDSPRRDELEPLGDVNGVWTSDPAGTVLLIRKDE